MVPIGWVHSTLKDPRDAPHQGRLTGQEAAIEVAPAYRDALAGIEECERVIVVCWLHRANRHRTRVHPRNDPARPELGVFATRSPNRPNPLAIYTAELLAVEGDTLRLRGIDAVDGTPVLDIRPYSPRLDR